MRRGNLFAFPLAIIMVLPDCAVLSMSSSAWKEVQQVSLDVTCKRTVWFNVVSYEKQAAPESRAVGVGVWGQDHSTHVVHVLHVPTPSCIKKVISPAEVIQRKSRSQNSSRVISQNHGMV